MFDFNLNNDFDFDRDYNNFDMNDYEHQQLMIADDYADEYLPQYNDDVYAALNRF